MDKQADLNELVTVTLVTKRPYRPVAEEKTIIEVGPGTVKVPRWVAVAWKMEPAEPEPVTPPAKPTGKKAH